MGSAVVHWTVRSAPGLPVRHEARIEGHAGHSAIVYLSRDTAVVWLARVDIHATGASRMGDVSEHKTFTLARAAASRRLREAVLHG